MSLKFEYTLVTWARQLFAKPDSSVEVLYLDITLWQLYAWRL